MANAFVIELKGELDKFCGLDKLMQAIADGENSQSIFIDLKEVVFIPPSSRTRSGTTAGLGFTKVPRAQTRGVSIGSGFINFLFILKKKKPELSQKIRLAGPNAQIQELLNLTGISELYPVCGDEFNFVIEQTVV